MNRKEFVKQALAAGAGLSFLSFVLESCTTKDVITVPDFNTNYSGKILIIGAGSAGMAAAYLLARHGIDFQIIEASDSFGGRVRRNDTLTDFPIDIGAEWIHGYPTLLSSIIDNPNVDAQIDVVTYNPQTFKTWKNGKLSSVNYARNFYSEYKFKSTTWYGFFENYLVPHFKDQLVVNTPIKSIDYSQTKVTVTDENGNQFEGDKVLITTPIKTLQDQDMEFTPALPSAKTQAINNVFMGDGLKVFIRFKEKFYPDMLFTDGLISSLTGDDKIYLDGAFRKDTQHHLMTLFTINSKATTFTQLGSDQAIFEAVMKELDEIFEGKASENYISHVVQNWSAEPYIKGSYSTSFNGDQNAIVDEIKKPVNGMLYFAGEALNINNQATVHGACESGYEVVKNMLGNS